MSDFAGRITEDQMGRLVQSEDPEEIAQVLDEILEELDLNVYKGYNDNHGFYIR